MASIYEKLNAYPLSDTFESIVAFKRKARCAVRLRALVAQSPEFAALCNELDLQIYNVLESGDVMRFLSYHCRSGLCVLGACLLLSLAACGASSSVQATQATPLTEPLRGGEHISASWLPLVQRLQADNIDPAMLVSYFSYLPEYSPAPMAVKVKELYNNAFAVKKPRDPDAPPPPPPSSIYKTIVTAANLERCKTFLTTYQTAFDSMEKNYSVPREIVASLILMETSLGKNLGNQNAFWSLAAMAATTTPELVAPGVPELNLTDKQEWLQTRLTDKSQWAYKELKALITHCTLQRLDPKVMPGSVYGAIGICQFMPSNLVPYGADGDGDGIVNLFSEPDAIHSVGRYLSAHGWKGTPAVAQQRQVILRYNKHMKYANTILAMAESITTGVLQTAAPDASGTVKVAASKVSGKAAKASGSSKAVGKTAKPSGKTAKPSGKTAKPSATKATTSTKKPVKK